MASQGFKQDLFQQFARVAKALSHANRLELLEFIAQGERSVEELSKVSGLSVANTSQHLQQLKQAGLVENHKQGLKVYYRLSSDEVLTLFSALRHVAESQLADVQQLVKRFLNTRDELEPVPFQELKERIEDNLVNIIDVRPQEEFAQGHVPGAINIPLSELEANLDKLDKNQDIVAYCRGPHCILAFDAVAKLRELGFSASRMEDGFPEWRLAGMPIERTDL